MDQRANYAGKAHYSEALDHWEDHERYHYGSLVHEEHLFVHRTK